MAESVRIENVIVLANGDTVSGPAEGVVVVAASAAAAVLSFTRNSDSALVFSLNAAVNSSEHSGGCLYLKRGETYTIALTGAGAKAYILLED